ncbi:MAG: hypothetical protein KA712_05035 [Myxococcales bacterium]|nr:hypothetical protein [Myxococcales bacterium]
MKTLNVRSGAFVAGLVLAACTARGPKTPEAAFARLSEAVSARNAEDLFEALDQDTRWSWMTVQKCQREAFDVVLSNFPEGPDRERQLRHLEAGATAETAAELFAARMGTEALASLAGRLPEPPVFTVAGSEAATPARSGAALLFRQIEQRWGYAGFSSAAEEQKRRAVADLELIKTSATDYERARLRGGS